MRKKKFLLSLLVVPLCLLIWSCGDDNDSDDYEGLAMCKNIASSFSYDNVVITNVESVTDETVVYDSDETYNTPEHCVVTGYMNEREGVSVPVLGSSYAIGFEMRLPVTWNGRFYYQANGGLDGNVHPAVGRFMSSNGADHTALSKGFAVISSDAGHSVGVPFFGLDPQARLDYGYNAVAELTPMAKALIEDVYGSQPDYSYFGGCSNGGRHTMVAASRYADDYDGYLVGNPGFNLPKAAVSQMYSAQQYANITGVTLDEDTNYITGAFTDVELALVASAVLDKCDDLDGLADGMINDTVTCQTVFSLDDDVATCGDDGRDGTCLSSEQKAAMNNIMAGATGEEGQIYASFPYDAGMAASNWSYWEFYASANLDPGAVGYIFTTPPTSFLTSGVTGYEYALGFDMDTALTQLNATDPDNGFEESGLEFMTMPDPTLADMKTNDGKMLVFHGTGDSVFSSDDTIDWYTNDFGSDTNHGRVFLVPGMNHCGAGPATDQFDGLNALINWVENGVAPDSVVASVRAENTELPDGASTTRTRPLCTYPEIAKYDSGDEESADSFYCEEP